MAVILEKIVVFVSLLAGFPLFFLDKEILGFRRFAWLIAMSVGLVGSFVVDPLDDLKATLDKILFAAVSITSVPHLTLLVKDSPLMGFATVPPLFVVIHLSVDTSIQSENYWKLQAFLHMAVFIIPYLNHLPAPPKPAEAEATDENVDTTTPDVKEDEAAATEQNSSSSKSKKTAKHKR